ncbi:MAG TPA: hypothetical protein VGF29_04955, partial [Hyphomicrobiaceae bacterium]
MAGPLSWLIPDAPPAPSKDDPFAGVPMESTADPFADVPMEVPKELAPKPRFVPQGEAVPEKPLPGFLEATGQGLEAGVSGVAETGEALVNRLRGQPLADPTETSADPRLAEIKPSEAIMSPIQKGLPWFGYMTGRSAPALAGALTPAGMIAGSGLGQFLSDYGPMFRENVAHGMSEDQALRAALKSAGVSATATGLSFGLPLKVLTQVIGQPSIASAQQVIQNYLAGRPLLEDAGEAAIAGGVGALPVVAEKMATRIARRARERGEQPPAAEEAPPPEAQPPGAEAQPLPGAVAETPLGREGPPPAEPPRPAASAEAPTGPAVGEDLFDFAIRGEEGEPPPAAGEARPPPAAEVAPPPAAVETPPTEVRGPVPRVTPRVEPRVEAPPPRVEPPPERVEPPPEKAAPPPKDDPFRDVPMEEPPAWVTERVPEEAAPSPPPAPVEAAPPPETPGQRARREAEARRREREAKPPEAELPMEEPTAPPAAPPPDVESRPPAQVPEGLTPTKPGEQLGEVRPGVLGKIKPKRPRSLMEFVADNGGFHSKDPLIQEVKDMFGGKGPQLIPYVKAKGRPIERMREAAAEAGYLPMESTIPEFLDKLRTDVTAKAKKEPHNRVYTRGEEGKAPEVPHYVDDEARMRELEPHLEAIDNTFDERGLRDKINYEYEIKNKAAEILHRGDTKDPFEAWDRAIVELGEADEKRAGVRGGGAEVHPPGGEGARPGSKKAITGPREAEPRHGPARKAPRQETSAEEVARAKEEFRAETGRDVELLDSMPLRTALAELDLSHLSPPLRKLAEFIRNRISQVAGDTAVHYISQNDLHAYSGTKPGQLTGGMWVGRRDVITGKPAGQFLFINNDQARFGAPAKAAHTLLHEGMHAASSFNLYRNNALTLAVRDLMRDLEPKLKTESGRRPYAMIDEHEFLAEVFGNPNVQEILHTAPTPPSVQRALGMRLGSAWNSMVEIVRRLLGLPEGARKAVDGVMQHPTYLETAMALGIEAMKKPPEPTVARTGSLVDWMSGKAPEKGPPAPELAPRGPRMPEKPGSQGTLFLKEKKAGPPEEKGAEGKPQLIIPGTEKDVAGALKRRAEAPLKPKAEQKPADFGLFGTEKDQPDLFGRIRDKKAVIMDAGNEALSDKLILHNHAKLSKVAGYLGGHKLNMTAFRVAVQDKFLRWKRVIEQWRRDNPGQVLPEEMDVYKAESVSHGKIDTRIRRADRDYVDPLLNEIKGNGLTLQEVGDYIYAKHAIERNAELRKINKNIADPSGMSDAEAQRILTAARGRQGNFDAVYQRFRKMVDDTLDMQVADGLISSQMAGAWKQRWPDYAPLRHTEVGEGWMAVGKGLEVRGKESRRALGRNRRAENPIAFAIEQMQRAIVRGEHNRVGEAVHNFVTANPEPALWTTQVPTVRYVNKKTGLVETRVDPNFRGRDDVFTYKDKGQDKSVRFVDPVYGKQLARALKNLQVKELNPVMRGISTATRTLAMLNTVYNPEFTVSNFVRDAGEAMMNMPAEKQKGMVASFGKHLMPSIKGAIRGQWETGGGRYADYFREFEEAGGRVGWMGAERAERISSDVVKRLKRLESTPINSFKNAAGKVLGALDVVNTGIENGTRLAAYISAREHGLSKMQAASIARELTVNFNRKGELGSNISALYMFANAGIQGPVRMMQALKTSKVVRRAAYGLAATGALMTIYNIAVGGEDKDGKSN